MHSHCKANQRIKRWSENPHQINHKIICAFLKCENKKGIANYCDMLKLCSTKDSKLYVKIFTEIFVV